VSGPVVQVVEAVRGGARSVAQIRRVTGLGADVVEAVVDYLASTGRLRSQPLASGCPIGAPGDTDCGSCTVNPRLSRRPGSDDCARLWWLVDDGPVT